MAIEFLMSAEEKQLSVWSLVISASAARQQPQKCSLDVQGGRCIH